MAGFFLVLSSLAIFEASNTSAQVRTVQSNSSDRYVSLSDFRKLVQAVKQNNDEVKNNTRLLQQLQRDVKKIKDDLYTMARTIRDNKEQSKRFDKKITFELEPRTSRLEQAVKELARRLPR
jgi:chromosome segregation ATPase